MATGAAGLEAAAPDSTAERALTAAVEAFAGHGGVLFEQAVAHETDFVMVATTGPARSPSPEAVLAAQSLLPRWLRVNRQALAIPDAIGVTDALDPRERNLLQTLGIGLAVPLLVDQDLVAWAGIVDPADPPSRPLPIPEAVLNMAAELQADRTARRSRSRAEAVARSHRLSVAGQMAAGIAHEVRNPLAAVRSMVQLVRNETVPAADRSRLLDSVVSEVDRVNRVLSGMLTLGRPSPARTECVDLAAIATDAVGFCRPYAKHRGQTLDIVVTECQWVEGDSHELRQVLVNLILNACQATPPGRTITVDSASKTTDDGKRAAMVRVMDPGEGIPPAVLARVFEPFYTTKQDGGGLGLAICRDAIQRHGGNIIITSEPGTGTTVAIEIPSVIPHGPHSHR